MAKALDIDPRMRVAYARAAALIANGKSRREVWDALVGADLTEGEADVIVLNAFDLHDVLAHSKRDLLWGGLLLLGMTAMMLQLKDGPWFAVLPLLLYALVKCAYAALGRPSPFR